jgi:diamine N-acetyltransferase
MAPSQSSAAVIELGPPRLEPLPLSSGAALGAAIAAMEPWSVMAYPPEKLGRFLGTHDPSALRYVVKIGEQESGVVSVRSPWLKGPYLELLALLPPAQGQGIGARIMAWLERIAIEEEARNLWVCASSFNIRALRFYERHGFERVATLPGLVAETYEEILLRKFPLGPRP